MLPFAATQLILKTEEMLWLLVINISELGCYAFKVNANSRWPMKTNTQLRSLTGSEC